MTSVRVTLGRLEERIAGLDRLTDEKFVKFRTMIDGQADKAALALASVDKAAATAVATATMAASKLETSYDERFKLLNELRTGVATSSELDALEKIMATLVSRLDRLEAHRAGTSSTFGMLAGGITLMVIVVNAVFFILSRS